MSVDLLNVGFGLIWIACLVITLLKGKLWSAIIGVVAVTAGMFGATVGGWYALNPLIYVPVFAAIRLGRPDFWWSNHFYSKNPDKFLRAVIRFGFVSEYLENRRNALTPEEFKQCQVTLTMTAIASRSGAEYVKVAIDEDAAKHKLAS